MNYNRDAVAELWCNIILECSVIVETASGYNVGAHM